MTAYTTAPAPRTAFELVKYFAQLEPSELPPTGRVTRRYGFEIETPQVARYASQLADAGFEITVDGSVSTEDCDCDCSYCSHDCDCSNCGFDSWDLEHCGICEANEASSPVCYTPKPAVGMRALEYLHESNREDMENGGHIHVEARDLSAVQVAAVMKAWRKIYELLPDLVGRDYNQWANEMTEDNQKWGEAKHIAVNATMISGYRAHLESGKYDLNPYGQPTDTLRTTIEFRQFASTAHAPIIYARASVCRALVDYIADNRGLYYLLCAESAEELLDLLQPERH